MSYSKVTVKSMAHANKIRNQVHQSQEDLGGRDITYAEASESVAVIQTKSGFRVQVRNMSQSQLEELVKLAGV
jgi:hypothetical protein